MNRHDYAAAIAELDHHTNYERATDYPAGTQGFGTARMEKLLAKMGAPERSFYAVHIAGTKGKGSTAYLTEALWRVRGIKTGLYVSPHIDDLRERIQIAGEMLTPEKFADAFFRAFAAADVADPPTYFELLTATAFAAFADADVKIAVIEVGLGGRLDATNVAELQTIAAAITLIDYDHTQILGDTLTAIAAEKAGIIRAFTPVVIAKQSAEARREILRIAESRNAPPQIIDQDFSTFARQSNLNGSRFSWRDNQQTFSDIFLSLCGEVQIDNAATAIALVKQGEKFIAEKTDAQQNLRLACQNSSADFWSAKTFTRAWENLRIPARIEVFNSTLPNVSNVPIVIDGAHTEQSVGAAVDFLENNFADYFPKIAVVSLNRDKRAARIIARLTAFFSEIIFTENFSGRAESGENLAKIAAEINSEIAISVISAPSSALASAKKSANENGMIAIIGSFYLAAELRPCVAEQFHDSRSTKS